MRSDKLKRQREIREIRVGEEKEGTDVYTQQDDPTGC